MTNDTMEKKDRLHKLKPNAWIGYLVGYESMNIYRVWNPKTNTAEFATSLSLKTKSSVGTRSYLRTTAQSPMKRCKHCYSSVSSRHSHCRQALLATSFLCKKKT
jgi:hypothetical protein